MLRTVPRVDRSLQFVDPAIGDDAASLPAASLPAASPPAASSPKVDPPPDRTFNPVNAQGRPIACRKMPRSQGRTRIGDPLMDILYDRTLDKYTEGSSIHGRSKLRHEPFAIMSNSPRPFPAMDSIAWCKLAMSPSGTRAITLALNECKYHNLQIGDSQQLDFPAFRQTDVRWHNDEMAIVYGAGEAHVLDLRQDRPRIKTFSDARSAAFVDDNQRLTWDFGSHIRRRRVKGMPALRTKRKLESYADRSGSRGTTRALLVCGRLICFAGNEIQVWHLGQDRGRAPLVCHKIFDGNDEVKDLHAAEHNVLFLLMSGTVWRYDIAKDTWHSFQLASPEVPYYTITSAAMSQHGLVLSSDRRYWHLEPRRKSHPPSGNRENLRPVVQR